MRGPTPGRWSRPVIGTTAALAVLAGSCAPPEHAEMDVPSESPASSTDQLIRHVRELAGELGERNIFRSGSLARAASLIEDEWTRQGYEVARQTYSTRGIACDNLEVERRGTRRPERILLVGAHYDSVRGSPGANDNGTGVAVLLELARRFSTVEPPITLRFVAFANEEPPFFFWGDMGSMVYARRSRERDEDIRLMIPLETLGYYSEEPGSQRYPPLFRYFYPDRANFVAFVSNFRSRRKMRRAVSAFAASSSFPVEHVAMFSSVPGISWSDHLSFWRQGYPAIMITDTALYRYPWYHTQGDTPDKVDYPALARLTDGLHGMLSRLLEEEE